MIGLEIGDRSTTTDPHLYDPRPFRTVESMRSIAGHACPGVDRLREWGDEKRVAERILQIPRPFLGLARLGVAGRGASSA